MVFVYKKINLYYVFMEKINKLNTLDTEVRRRVQPSLFDLLSEEDLIGVTNNPGEPASKYLEKDENWWESDRCFDSKFFEKFNSK